MHGEPILLANTLSYSIQWFHETPLDPTHIPIHIQGDLFAKCKMRQITLFWTSVNMMVISYSCLYNNDFQLHVDYLYDICLYFP